jgi:hypothetical protein
MRSDVSLLSNIPKSSHIAIPLWRHNHATDLEDCRGIFPAETRPFSAAFAVNTMLLGGHDRGRCGYALRRQDQEEAGMNLFGRRALGALALLVLLAPAASSSAPEAPEAARPVLVAPDDAVPAERPARPMAEMPAPAAPHAGGVGELLVLLLLRSGGPLPFAQR